MAGEILHSPKQFVLCLCVNVSRSKSFSLSSIQCKLKVLGHFAGCCVTLCASVERMVLILRVFLRVRSRSSHARSKKAENNEQALILRVVPRVDSRTFPHEEVEQQLHCAASP